MIRFARNLTKSRLFVGMVLGFVLTAGGLYMTSVGMQRTSTNDYCASCHVHPQAISSWKKGPHYQNTSGVVTNCIDCHLPPKGFDHVVEKSKAGLRDLYSFYFTDVSKIDWEALSSLENAAHYTFDESCMSCHQELFPIGLNEKGVDAHLHYQKNLDELQCINCHLKTGHYHDEPDEQFVIVEEEEPEPEEEMAPLLAELPEDAFEDYTDVIPGTSVRFQMIAVEAGIFTMGSPEDEPGRDSDEGPAREVQLDAYWIGKYEVSWREFEAYYAETVTRGKNESGEMTDALAGPTPPYGSPDQGWGKGNRPSITMSHYAARKYCEWLSHVTGRLYRLPTEAEWECAARAGTQGPYPVAVELTSWSDRWKAKLLGGASIDAVLLGEYAWFDLNSGSKTHPQGTTKPNPWGIHNMMGNAWEFCSDLYAPSVLSSYPSGAPVLNPRGPDSGEEYVIRGGSYRSEYSDLRSSARASTNHDGWMKTDPQTPKSVWWYSDSNDVGFRVVRELEKESITGSVNGGAQATN